MASSIFPFYGISLADGAVQTLSVYGRMLSLLDVTGSDKVSIAFPGQPYVKIRQGLAMELPDDPAFDQIMLKNEEGVAITVDLIVSEGRVFDNGSEDVASTLTDIETELLDQGVSLDDIETVLNSILEFTRGDTTEEAYSRFSVGLTGVLASAANVDRKGFHLQADKTNTGKIFLGADSSVSATNFFHELAAGEAWWTDKYRGIIYAISDTAAQNVSILEY